jgi:hypothetical protein
MHEEAPSCYCPYDLILSSIVGRTARTTLFAGVAGLVVIFAWFLLPETKLAKMRMASGTRGVCAKRNRPGINRIAAVLSPSPLQIALQRLK